MKPHFASLFAVCALVAPAFAQAPTHPDLVYATVGATDLHLDLYLPTAPVGPAPLLIYIHGGGWSGGSKSPIPGPCVQALNQGFAVAALDYRLTSQAALFAPEPVTFPAQIHDVKAAVRWLRANAATFALDPTRFASFGSSAGGHLSALLAMSGGVPELEGTVGGNAGFSSEVQAAIDYFGPTDLLQMNLDVLTPPGSMIDHDAPTSPESRLLGWDGPGQGVGDLRAHLTDPTPPYPDLVQLAFAANPIHWVDANDPPLFVAHGTNDVSVPVKQSTRLSAALFAAGVRHDFRALPLAGHGFGGPIDGVALDFVRSTLFGASAPDVGVSVCAGDSGGCPCANASFAGANTGCTHSLFVGANLNAVGQASIADDTLRLRADSMPNGTVLFFQGPGLIAGGLVLDDGLRCAGNPVRRLGVKATLQGWASYPGPADSSVSVRGGALAGDTIYYQAWFRDAAAFCSAGTANLTNTLAVTWIP